MPKNSIQFQKGFSIAEFMQMYGTEMQCKEHLFHLRWKNGYICPYCGSKSYCELKSRPLYQCNKCHHQTSLTAGTLFSHSKLPLTTWFLAIYLITQDKNSISALELKRKLGISYNAAWRIKHKLMQVMKEHDDNRKLSNIVQLDDAYIGGKQKGKRGRGAEGKTPFVSAISLNEEGHPIYMRLSVVSCFKKQEITEWAKKHLKEKTLVISDGLPCFNGLVAADIIHGSLSKNGKELHQYEAAFHWVDTMIGNVKNSIKGTYHAIREKHIPRYFGEFCFRFNYRFRVEDIFNSLIKCGAKSPPMPEKLLTLAEARW